MALRGGVVLDGYIEAIYYAAMMRRDFGVNVPITSNSWGTPGAAPQSVVEAIQAGASGYLVKRVGPDKIHSAIVEVMAGGTVLEANIAKRFWNYFQSVQTRAPAPQNPWGLTPEELQVLQYVARGLSNAEVGEVMALQRRTVRTHLSHVYKKMGVSSHVEAVVLALRAGCVDL